MKRALTVSLLMDPSIFIPRFLRACLFALLPEKDSYRNIKIPRGKGGGITPNLQLYFQASQLNYPANWAQRKINTSRHQVSEGGMDELRHGAAREGSAALPR